MGRPTASPSYFSYKHGIWAIRTKNRQLVLKAPWNPPLFSEREGYYVWRIPLGFGWRVFLRRYNPQWSWKDYKKRLMYTYLYEGELNTFQRLIARMELHRRIRKRERI